MSKENSKNTTTKVIQVNALARVEGEGGLFIKMKGKEVVDVQLKIFEPPRFFEAMLRGRKFTEAPDITARICGICPVAYQMSACHAMEDACGVRVDGMLRALRRLLYCGEWIESHTLHVYMLHAPDFLGYEGVVQMAKDFPKDVERGLALKKAGNLILKLLGGREIHPINVRVGGFYRVPTKQELVQLVEPLKWARDAAYETVRWVSTFSFPESSIDYELVALRHPNEYPMNEGRIVSSKGLDIETREFDEYIKEEQVAHSTALHATLRSRSSYLVGPVARYNLNFDKLSPLAKAAAVEANLGKECKNFFGSIIVRSVEILYACDEALRIIEGYQMPAEPAVKIVPGDGVGYGCTEAPRGILYHRYQINAGGDILDAKIVPPTSQNQKTIEKDLHAFVEKNFHLPKERLRHFCEQTIRNYDPCISCSTHFLKLQIENTEETGDVKT